MIEKGGNKAIKSEKMSYTLTLACGHTNKPQIEAINKVEKLNVMTTAHACNKAAPFSAAVYEAWHTNIASGFLQEHRCAATKSRTCLPLKVPTSIADWA